MSVTDALQCANNTAVIRTFRGHTVACGMTTTITLAQALLAEGTSSLAPLIEKELGIKSSHESVKRMGIAKYNEHCRGIVMRYAKEWECIATRCGRWIDFVNDCKTMSVSFMESVWWLFKAL